MTSHCFHTASKCNRVRLTRLGLDLRLHRLSFGTQDLGESPSEAAVAQRVEEGVDGRVQPQHPERDLVPVVGHAGAAAGGSDDHEQRVRGPADPKYADDDG